MRTTVVYGNCWYMDCKLHCTDDYPCNRAFRHGLIRIPTYLINDPIANLKYQLKKQVERLFHAK